MICLFIYIFLACSKGYFAQAVRGSVHQIVDLTHVYTQTDHVPCVLQDGRVIIVLQVIPTLSIRKFTNIGYVFNVTRNIKGKTSKQRSH